MRRTKASQTLINQAIETQVKLLQQMCYATGDRYHRIQALRPKVAARIARRKGDR